MFERCALKNCVALSTDTISPSDRSKVRRPVVGLGVEQISARVIRLAPGPGKQ